MSLKSLDEKLDYYHHRQVELVRGATAVSSEGFAALEKKLPEISRKIGDLENLRREKAADEPHRQFHLQACYKDSFETQRVVNCYLESAFVHAGLMSASVERETDTPTSSGQFDAVHSMVSVPTGGSSLHCCAEAATSQNLPPQRSVSVETEPVITLPEDIAALDLYRDYVRAKHRLNRAQWEFDLRDETREHEQYWNDRDLRRSGGTEGLPQEQFDLLWVEHISKLTRALIDAEEAFKTARTAAVSGGCQLEDPDASSVFEDDDDEGYPPSREAILKANAPKGMIEGWRKSVADKSGYPDTSAASAELDSRDGDEADLWGSWSVAADPPRQGKIRQWEKACTVADKKPVI